MRLCLRCLACLCAFVLLLCGTAAAAESALRGYAKDDGYVYVCLGSYPQKADGSEEPILWRVLSVDDEKVWLLSEYILFARAMHTSLKEYRDVLKGDFAQTELCQYLNSTFIADAFSSGETGMLLPHEKYGKVFLLSREELSDKTLGPGVTLKNSKSAKKIQNNPGVRAWGTEWAIQDNGYPKDQYPNPKARIRNAAGTADISVAEKRLFVYSADRGSVSPYWTRSQSSADARHASCTKADGTIGHIEVGRDNEGVRPSVYLSPESFVICGGQGTKEDPYLLRPRTEEVDLTIELIETIPEGDAEP